MFTQHPKDSEFFDINIFVEDNHSMIRHIYEQCRDEIDRIQIHENDEDRLEKITCLIASAIWNNETELEFPLKVNEEDTEELNKFTEDINSYTILLSLEDKGLIERNEQGEFTATELGNQVGNEVTKQEYDNVKSN